MTRRLLGSYLLITALALILLGVPLAVFFAQRERERVTAGLEHDATVIATIYEDDLENGRPLDPAAALEYSRRTGARVVVVDAEGTFDRPYEPFHRGGLNQMTVRTDDGREGTAIYEITGARHHRYFPDTLVEGILPS